LTDPLNRTFTPSDEAVDSSVGDEVVILHLGNNTYYGLDPLGTRIWAMLKEAHQPRAIRDALLAEYNVSAQVLEADMRKFLSDLLAHDILVATPV
jgi:hypothetical protein